MFEVLKGEKSEKKSDDEAGRVFFVFYILSVGSFARAFETNMEPASEMNCSEVVRLARAGTIINNDQFETNVYQKLSDDERLLIKTTEVIQVLRQEDYFNRSVEPVQKVVVSDIYVLEESEATFRSVGDIHETYAASLSVDLSYQRRYIGDIAWVKPISVSGTAEILDSQFNLRTMTHKLSHSIAKYGTTPGTILGTMNPRTTTLRSWNPAIAGYTHTSNVGSSYAYWYETYGDFILGGEVIITFQRGNSTTYTWSLIDYVSW